ncbi:mini-chromosome maintenance complex-binding protein-like [Pyrus ussuriensis x Pyrus communis]|uniref:Mini-chromosome maintenance complex-binding protein-like n=1 Tax=Pyrus ussuriensis x Pyrus communis TaxID=2448454 RepID=A0A5N5H762_9ROSA|nr:mini-chromosome maintenance complex-binding protein-like [Pyrus ussuriensis x Pyrus communis]
MDISEGMILTHTTDAKFGRKKAPEPQQNVQSIDGVVTNGSSSCEENTGKRRTMSSMYPKLYTNLLQEI